MDAVLQKATEKLHEMFPTADRAYVSHAVGSSDGRHFQSSYTVYIEFHPTVGHVMVINPILEMAMAKAMAQACEKCRKATKPEPALTYSPRMFAN